MKTESLYPDFFARFYDTIYHKVRTGVDTEFFLRKILATNGPVLEVGVGTGRFFTEALENGADIYGIDISSTMIERLKEKLPAEQHSRVSVQDAVNLTMDKKFDLIVAPFRVLSHVIEIENHVKFLNSMYDHLNPGGIFIFDLYVPDLKMISEGLNSITDFEGEYEAGKSLKRIVSMHADIVNQLSFVEMTLIWDENGETVTKTWNTEIRFFFRFEIEHLVARSKLELKTMYGDYDETLLNKGSRDFIVVCEKKE